ncbi:FAD-dependent pyridine nucleotide-disulfide oxidoreductase [Nitzschia inconspicua]|uniref:FAD-dependent pyridine nucleotide-disulfide oxidoreductase n=1 Tax=Nitzschia inconspicua TaxID=303405 RepID=A0A9K3KU65_9STRA|nr:FAD-dependent pyridine nucleotide-disulfide oxidoreductase [Nitzschia inconspicua]
MSHASKILECDYLVVGAGAASLAFIDTLLTELPNTKVILIDKKEQPGGHWQDAYGFVRLHQPSLVYGVASKQLEGNWLKLVTTKLTLPWNHRATKQEILKYFGDFVNDKIATKQLEFYPNSTYNFEMEPSDGLHSFSDVHGTINYQVKVNIKLVDGTAGECIVPSQNPLQIPFDDGITVMTPNDVYDAHLQGKYLRSKKFVVLGAGKTAMDTVVFLQRTMNVKPNDIAWVIPNDVWMLRLDGNGNPWSWPVKLLECEGDEAKASLELERKGMLDRLDKDITPTRFRFPVIPKDELKLLRKIEKTIRRGRATALRKDGDDVIVEFGNDHPAWKADVPADNCVFVHATSPGPFNGLNAEVLFNDERTMTLNLLTAPPVSSSMSTMGKLEAARRKGTLDLEFTNHLFQIWKGTPESNAVDGKASENDLLRWAIRGYKLSDSDSREKVKPLVTLAMFVAILDKDPMVAMKWMKGNRLIFFSIPGFKGGIYENLLLLQENGKTLGFLENDVKVFEALAEKLQCLKGM